jgi:YihY family inner membrane protein
VLAASLAHSGFVSLFPLLLVLVTILGLVASSDPAVRHEALTAVAKQIPLIGHQLAGNVHQLRRSSVIFLVAGLLALTWGTTGLAQAGLFTMAQVWNLPGPARPGYLQRLGRAALFLGVLGLGVIVTTLLTSLGAYGHHAIAIAGLLEALAVAANIGMYLIGFRVLTPKGVPARKLVPGAVAGGAAWTVLQALGTYVVHHFLHSDSVYGVFATVLGLLAWIYLGVEITVYAAEINRGTDELGGSLRTAAGLGPVCARSTPGPGRVRSGAASAADRHQGGDVSNDEGQGFLIKTQEAGEIPATFSFRFTEDALYVTGTAPMAADQQALIIADLLGECFGAQMLEAAAAFAGELEAGKPP